jgi:hypothetical protein
VYLGFVVFICGWVFQTVQIGASLPYSPQYYYSKTNRYGRLFFWWAAAWGLRARAPGTGA